MNGKKAFWYAIVGGIVTAGIVLAIIIILILLTGEPIQPPTPTPLTFSRRAVCDLLSPAYRAMKSIPQSCIDPMEFSPERPLPPFSPLYPTPN